VSGVLHNSRDGKKNVSPSSGGVYRALFVINDENNHSESVKEIYTLAETLKDRFFFQPDNIIFLTGEEAGEEQIIAVIENLIQSVDRQDTVVIRFSNEKILNNAGVNYNLDTLSKVVKQCIL